MGKCFAMPKEKPLEKESLNSRAAIQGTGSIQALLQKRTLFSS